MHAETVEEWRLWLAEHHATSRGVDLVSWKKHTGRPVVGYDEAVTEALAVGWVDSVAHRLDEDRTMLWFSPRNPRSGWSAPNKRRIARLEAEGRLGGAGLSAVEVAKANGAWVLLDEVEQGIVPPDLAAALAEQPGSKEQWEAFPRSARRGMLEWVVRAKRPETRGRRVRAIAEAAARGERALG